MIEIPIHDIQGAQIDVLRLDEGLLGGQVRPALLKQAYVRFHANRRLGTSKTKGRGLVEGSGKKMYRQKGTGNARHGTVRANVMRGGGHGHAKVPHSWRQGMPKKMRRLANRNAMLAKLVDGEVKLVEGLGFEKPSTKRFVGLMSALKIDRTCLVVLDSTRGPGARSAANVEGVRVARVESLNAFDVLNHRYLVSDRATFQFWIDRFTVSGSGHGEGA